MMEEYSEDTLDELVSAHPALILSPSPPLDISTPRANHSDDTLLSHLGNGWFHETELHEVEDEDGYERLHTRDEDSDEKEQDSILYQYELISWTPDSEPTRGIASHPAPSRPNTSTTRLVSLPQELQTMIAKLLEPEDIFNLASSCKSLAFLIRENLNSLSQTRPFCREALMDKYSSSKGLRIYLKRCEGLRVCRPFLIVYLGRGYDFICADRILCYTPTHTELRLLDLDQANDPTSSFTISVFEALPMIDPLISQQHIRPLHYAHGYVSVLCSWRGADLLDSHHLVVLDRSDRKVITSRLLPAYRDICVRNNRDWLYCSLLDEDDQWSMNEFCIRTAQWRDNNIPLTYMPSGTISVHNCFEIFDGFLYAASSAFRLDAEQAGDSYYYVFRIQLGEPTHSEVMTKPYCMRRQTTKVNVDDRWSSLHLHKDESSGDIYLYEGFLERAGDQSRSRRCCYRMKLVFTESPRNGFPGQSTMPEHWTPDWDGLHKDNFQDIWSDSHIRSAAFATYIPACGTFLDIIPPDTSNQPSNATGLLQIGTRPFSMQERESSRHKDRTYTWPGEQHKPSNLLRQVLQPTGKLQAFMDNGVLAFAKQSDSTQRRDINYVSFDPNTPPPLSETSLVIGRA